MCSLSRQNPPGEENKAKRDRSNASGPAEVLNAAPAATDPDTLSRHTRGLLPRGAPLGETAPPVRIPADGPDDLAVRLGVVGAPDAMHPEAWRAEIRRQARHDKGAADERGRQARFRGAQPCDSARPGRCHTRSSGWSSELRSARSHATTIPHVCHREHGTKMENRQCRVRVTPPVRGGPEREARRSGRSPGPCLPACPYRAWFPSARRRRSG